MMTELAVVSILILRETDFICENCNSKVVSSVNGGDKNYVIGAKQREIDRRIRTGEYKQINKP